MAHLADDDVIGVTTKGAASLADISSSELAAWERVGLVRPQAARNGSKERLRVYGLDQLVELRVVTELQRRGISVDRIHKLADAYRSAAAQNRLRQLLWGVDGKHVYVQFSDGGWYGGKRPMQGVITETINIDEIRTSLRKAVRERPGAAGEVEKRRRTMGNKELFAGTRTPVPAVQSYLKRGIPDSKILASYPHLQQSDIDYARRALLQSAS